MISHFGALQIRCQHGVVFHLSMPVTYPRYLSTYASGTNEKVMLGMTVHAGSVSIVTGCTRDLEDSISFGCLPGRLYLL